MSTAIKGILEKLSIKPGCSSGIFPGRTAVGRLIRSERANPRAIDVINLSDVEVGNCLLVFNTYCDFIKCSDIVDIIKVTEDELEVETETSIYRFTRIKEEDLEDKD